MDPIEIAVKARVEIERCADVFCEKMSLSRQIQTVLNTVLIAVAAGIITTVVCPWMVPVVVVLAGSYVMYYQTSNYAAEEITKKISLERVRRDIDDKPAKETKDDEYGPFSHSEFRWQSATSYHGEPPLFDKG